MRRRAPATAALVAAVFLLFVLYGLATLPARPRTAAGDVTEDLKRRTIPGAFHVHSTRSDGTADVDAIAAAASRAGLRFVVTTDHGDGTRAPDAPGYRHGVLVIDAVEISTRGGHYVALGIPAAPYPLGGDASAVVEDVRRLGGFGVAAHPDSPKAELQWRDASLAVDGMEWLSLDSEWRDESRATLARVAMDYVVRPGPALASILDRPGSLDRWQAATRTRPVVAMGAHDAHGGISEGVRGGARALLALPSYEASFRTFAVRAVLDGPLTGDARPDADALLGAFRRGRVFTAIDALATPAFIDYRIDVDGRAIPMGESALFAPGAIARVRCTVPADGRLVLLRDGQAIAEAATGELNVPLERAGVYRVEVRAGNAAVPWLLSNPIYLRERMGEDAAREPQATSLGPIDASAQVEKDPQSTAGLSRLPQGFALSYRLAPDVRHSQYVAASIPVANVPPADALVLDARASGPMRVSIQLRFNARGGARWGSSVYVSPDSRRVVVPLDALVPLDGGAARPAVPSASSILFVIDLTNASPGQSGSLEISHLSFASLTPSRR